MSGRVLVASRGDTVPVVGSWVVLHRVDSLGGAPVDSARTDAEGSYFVRAPDRDIQSLYIPAVEYLGIAYFGTTLRPRQAFNMDTSETIVVFDTSSTGDPLFLAEKHVVIRELNEDGSRPVLELLVIENRSDVVRITPDGVVATWMGALPPGAVELEVAPSDVSPDAIIPGDGYVRVFAPIPPGEKQLVYGYTLPPGAEEIALPVDQPIGRIQLLLSDTTATVRSAYVTPQGNESVERFRFARWEGTAPEAAGPIRIQFTATPFAIEQLWWVVVVLSAAVFGVALWSALRRPQRVAVVADVNVLAARIAELDARLERGADDALRREREELRVRLAQALARQSAGG